MATLRVSSPLAVIFPAGAPVDLFAAQRGSFAGVSEAFYRVSWNRCSETQRQAVADLVAAQCGGTAAEVLTDWMLRGWLPLRERHVSSVSFDARLVH